MDLFIDVEAQKEAFIYCANPKCRKKLTKVAYGEGIHVCKCGCYTHYTRIDGRTETYLSTKPAKD